MTMVDVQHVLFPEPRLELKPQPDGFGFVYGQLFAADGEVYRVDIMPPAGEWSGDLKPSGDLPHPTDWVIHVDGEEIARVQRRADIHDAITRCLATA